MKHRGFNLSDLSSSLGLSLRRYASCFYVTGIDNKIKITVPNTQGVGHMDHKLHSAGSQEKTTHLLMCHPCCTKMKRNAAEFHT